MIKIIEYEIRDNHHIDILENEINELLETEDIDLNSIISISYENMKMSSGLDKTRVRITYKI
jgi:hypothetical protein